MPAPLRSATDSGQETPLSTLCRLCALRPLYGQAYQGEKDSGTSKEAGQSSAAEPVGSSTLAPSERYGVTYAARNDN
jgi:hypothetical protein